MPYVTFASELDKILERTSEAKRRALEIIGGKAESYAKAICPVDTGNLRNSITHQQYDEDSEMIGTNVEYGPYVELGTYRQKAQPYLRPAAEEHGTEYQTVMETELRKGIF